MAEPVLIADASLRRWRRLQRLLVGLGYTVRHVAGGAEAFHHLRSERYAAALLSGPLPDVGLAALARTIRRRWPDTALLARADRPEEFRELAAYLDGLLPTPLRAEALGVLLRGVCERGALRRKLREQRKLTTRRLAQRVETERYLTVKQIVDKLSTFIGRITREVEGGVRYFNEMPYFVSIHNRRHKIVATNRVFRTLLGATVGQDSWDIYAGASRSRSACPVGRTIASGVAQESIESIRYRNGAVLPVLVHTAPIYNDRGRVELVLEVFAGTQDIERRKEDARTAQQRYQLLFDAVPCYVAVLGRDLRITANNRFFIDEFGDQTGLPFGDVFLSDSGTVADSPVTRTFSHGEAQQGEMAFTAPNRRCYETLVWTSPIADPAGMPVQALLVFMDVTQIRSLQNNLTSLGLMLASISHSIKSVLTGLDAGVYTMDKAFSRHDDRQLEEGLELVKRMAERIRKITLDILFYARERELNPVPLDIRQFAEEVVENVQPRFDRRGVRLVCEFQEPLGGFEADPGLLKAAMVNLLDNAVDACPAADGRTEARVVFCVQAGPERIGMSVDDTGQGMTPDQLKKLFTLFYSTKGVQGTGLGLFLTDKIVRQHGGDIAVESTPGRGSRFCVQLPRRQPASTPTPAAQDLPPLGPGIMGWGGDLS